ncbi:MAG TPA: glycoside hydrolase family 38 C-terminal domain-containing protein [Candidatus Sulfotelmatobacter sp.]|nr:glycoside hydrolase family 38 C-terminal domain-containing protein [Candidatus Sulfotelmatobacter sp.]
MNGRFHWDFLRSRALVTFLTCVCFSPLALIFSIPNCLAQTELPDEAKRELKNLPPAAQAAIPKLFAMDSLPQPQWKMHVADMPHGEATDLDDSSWTTVKTPSEGPEDAVWYRAWIEYPKSAGGHDISGARVSFQFDVSADGLGPTIIYFNGRRVAMGDDLEPISLFDGAKAGDRVLVAVKLPRSKGAKHLQGAQLLIDRPSSGSNSGVLWRELFSLGEFSRALGSNANEANSVIEKASAGINFSALQKGDQQAFDKSISAAQEDLNRLRPEVKALSLQMTGNSHIDAAWLWPWTETVDVVHRTFGTALQLMEEYPQLHFAQSAAQYSEWMEQKYPPLFQQTVDRAKQHRWELVGGMWVEPDLNMPDGESLVRQILIGKRYFRQKYDVDVRIGWNPDSFGYNWQLPQIYKKSGIDYFVTQKMSWNETNQLPLTLFWWQSPDGSRVLTYFPTGYGGSIEPVRLGYQLGLGYSHNPGLTQAMNLFGEGDHGGGPTRDMLDRGLRWTEPDVIFPKMNFGSAQDFFSSVETKLDTEHSPVWDYKSIVQKPTLPAPSGDKIELPIWNDELYLEFHRGVFTTQAKHKQNMRESEEWLLNAEKYSALAWLRGDSYPTERFNFAWKKVLFNQFHDLAAGSGIGVIYKDAQHDYDVAHWTASEAASNAIRTLSADINTRSIAGTPVVVWNPLAWERSDLVTIDVQLPEKSTSGIVVTDSRNKPLLFQVLSSRPETNSYHLLVKADNVPSLGYTVLHVAPGAEKATSDLSAHELTLENSLTKLTVEPKTGCVTSLFDKQAHFESIAAGACGNELIAFQDKPKDFDAWNIDADFEKVFTRLDMAESVKLIEQGPLRATIQIVRSWQNSKFVQNISLYAGLKRVDVANDIDWHESHLLLKAAFPLAASSAEATYEIPFGTINRPTTRNNSWEAAKFEVPALRWADLGDSQHGFSLINESKYGYDAKGNTLRISLLRSPKDPDPEADQGHHHFSYSLYPHAEDWRKALTVRHGYEFNYKLQARQVDAHDGRLGPDHSFVGIGDENLVLTSLKKTEDGDALLLRFYEWAGKSGSTEVQMPEGAVSAKLANMMEQAQGDDLPVKDGKISVPFHPFEIVSVRVSYPAPSR